MNESAYLDDIEHLNQSTEETLVALTWQIDSFVRNGTLDSRCATKLIKQVKKEAEIVVLNGNSTRTGHDALQKAFDALDASVCAHDASLLVSTNAELRTADMTRRGGK